MKSLFQFLFLILFLSFVYGNCKAQKIEVNELRAKETYEVESVVVKQKNVAQRLASDKAALDRFRSGRAWNIAGIGTCGSGGAVLLSGVALAIDNSVKNEVLSASEKVDDSLSWILIGTGIGVLIPGAIMILHGRNQRIKAVKSFNETVDGSARRNPVLIKPATRGIGLSLHF